MRNILLIDDDPAIYHTMQIVLDSIGCNLVYFGDTAPAAQYINAGNKIDLIILDIMIPGLSGLDFMNVLSGMGCKAPVLIISAIDTARAATEALKKGALDYITKPFTLEHMKEAVQKLLN